MLLNTILCLSVCLLVIYPSTDSFTIISNPTTTYNIHNTKKFSVNKALRHIRSSSLNILSTDIDTDGIKNKINDSVTTSSNSIFKHGYIAEQTRDDFLILKRKKVLDNNDNDENNDKPIIYLDSAATSQKPIQVINEITNYYNNYNSNVHRGAHTLSREATNAYEEARDKIYKFINSNNRNEIIFTSGATDSINLICQTYGKEYINKDDIIILTVAEHHSNLIPWQMLCKEKQCILKFIDIDNNTGTLDLIQFQNLLNDIPDPNKIKLISFQHVSNVLGCINPVNEIVSMIRTKCNNNCKILLDACQSIPHMVVDVQELDIDFLVASGHKMCGPTGIGFLYGKENILNALPPYKGGGEMIDTVSLYDSTYQLSPARFEAGTPQIAQAIGLGYAIDYLNNIGMNNINNYEHELGAYLYEQLNSISGITILGPKINEENPTNRAALCAFVHDKVHSSDLSTFLDMNGNIAIRAGHHCCQPLHTRLNITHSARASLYFYNTKEDIDCFIEELKRTINFFISSLDESTNGTDDNDDFLPFI